MKQQLAPKREMGVAPLGDALLQTPSETADILTVNLNC